MASIHAHRGGYRAHIYIRGVLRTFWLGKCTKAQASYVLQHLDQLKIAAEIGTPIGPATQEWLANIGPRIRSKLAEFGLIQCPSTFPLELAAFCDKYIDTRTDWQPASRGRMQNVRNHLVDQIGGDTLITAVTPGDAERFARWARRHFRAASHSGKIIADARQFFAAAIKERLIKDNPFAGIKASRPHDRTREAYVTEETVDKLICATTKEFAAVLACARYGGLRIPSEVLALCWQDIDWEAGIVRVTDVKRQMTREVPLFPRWRNALDAWWSVSPEGEHVFTDVRASANKTYRKRLLELLARQKVAAWPKLWQNLRASRETDLKRQFPGEHHAVHAWIGNSEKVSAKHYDRISDDLMRRAVES